MHMIPIDGAGRAVDAGVSSSPAPVTMLLGSPRSGTSWIAKILDSHPDVIYRHEPDISRPNTSFPFICPDFATIAAHQEAARKYLLSLLDERTLKSAGSRPVFSKKYRSPVSHNLYRLEAELFRVLSHLPLLGRPARRMHLSGRLEAPRELSLPYVIKSVSSLGRAGLFAAAMPEARMVLILRHPCGQIASSLRGLALRKFENSAVPGGGLKTGLAERHGLTPERFARLPAVEQHAWD